MPALVRFVRSDSSEVIKNSVVEQTKTPFDTFACVPMVHLCVDSMWMGYRWALGTQLGGLLFRRTERVVYVLLLPLIYFFRA